MTQYLTYQALVYFKNDCFGTLSDTMQTIIAARNATGAADYLFERYLGKVKRIKIWEVGTRNEPNIFRGEFF
jgi:hypothetical protein